MYIFRLLVKTPSSSKPFIACLASQLVKDGHPKLGLMQRAMSIFLYGNGASKDVRMFLIIVVGKINFNVIDKNHDRCIQV